MPEKKDSFLVDLSLNLDQQIAAVGELMAQGIGHSYLLLPYYKKLLDIASRGGKEPHERPFVEKL